MIRSLRGLALTCHLLPSVAVTAFAAAFGATVGLPSGAVLRLAAAVLSGQLSIGWLNDLIDREIDRRAGRRDKPLATDDVSPRTVKAAFGCAVVVCGLASFSLGVWPGALHLLAVGSAYSYDVRLKGTVVSWLPFAVSFGLLPAVATTSLAGQPFPPVAIVIAGSVLGVGAHFANTVKDTEADAVTGVRGLPQRIGPSRALVVSALALALAAASVIVAVPHSVAVWVLSLLAVGATVVATALAARGAPRLAFPGVVLGAALVVVGLVFSGTRVGG